MTQDAFIILANKTDMFRAIWTAQYYGVGMTTVKAYVATLLQTLTN